MEFNAVITKTAFWQNGGLDMTNSTETDQKYWIREREEKKNQPFKNAWCAVKKVNYTWRPGTDYYGEPREVIRAGSWFYLEGIWQPSIFELHLEPQGKKREQNSGSVQGAKSTTGSFYVNLGPWRPAPNIRGSGNKPLGAARPLSSQTSR